MPVKWHPGLIFMGYVVISGYSAIRRKYCFLPFCTSRYLTARSMSAVAGRLMSVTFS